MPVVEESIYIPRPVSEIFDFLVTPGVWERWDSALVGSPQFDERPIRAGTRIAGRSKVLGRGFDWTLEVTTYDPPYRIGSSTIDGDVGFSLDWILEPEGEGTRFTERIDASAGLGGVFGKMADSIVQRAHSHTLKGNLKTLRLHALESSTV